jgi:hypothetical protein
MSELTLTGKTPLKRVLNLMAEPRGSMSAGVYPSSGFAGISIAWASERLANCRLYDDEKRPSLWVGHAAFDVSPSEARQIREKFEPIGLRIETPAAPAFVLPPEVYIDVPEIVARTEWT